MPNFKAVFLTRTMLIFMAGAILFYFQFAFPGSKFVYRKSESYLKWWWSLVCGEGKHLDYR